MSFARYMGDLFGVRVACKQAVAYRDWNDRALVQQQTQDYDLVILQEPDGLLWQRLFANTLRRKFVEHASTSVLLLRRPRRPVKRLLLYLEGGEADRLAVEWAACLARLSNAEIIVLAITPPVPTMFHGLARMQTDQSRLMTSHSLLGSAMRHAEQRLQAENVQSRLQLRQGDFEWEFRSAVIESNTDLITIAAKAARHFERWLGGDPVTSLLRWPKRPVLVVKPTSP